MKQPANRHLVMLAGCKHFGRFSLGALADFPDNYLLYIGKSKI